jgi:hypothetical protein
MAKNKEKLNDLRRRLVEVMALTDADGPIDDDRLVEEVRRLVKAFESAAADRSVLRGDPGTKVRGF